MKNWERNQNIGCLISFITVFFTVICISEYRIKENEKCKMTQDVEKIYMNSPTSFTFLIDTSNGLVLEDYKYWSTKTGDRPLIVADVPQDKKMFFKASKKVLSSDYTIDEIHIHSEDDLEAGNRSYGKFGTRPIQEIGGR